MDTSEAISTAQIITDWLEAARLYLVADLETNNRNATGKTSRSLRVVVVSDQTQQLLGNENVFATFTGRGPGKMPPLNKIIEWCVARNIPRNRAWIIAKNISLVGTEIFRKGGMTKNAILDVTSKENVAKLVEQLTRAALISVRSDFDKFIISK